MFNKTCPICKTEFETNLLNKKFCSPLCSQKNQASKYGRQKSFNLPCGTVGTISEFKVALDLMIKGYEVYRPITPNCSGDFMIEKDNKFLKIEVKTGYLHSESDKLSFPKTNIRANILAVVINANSTIRYFFMPGFIKTTLP